MNKYVIRRLMALLVAAWAAGAALASGIIKDVTIRQVKPWQGMVEVAYELTTDVSSKANLATSVVFTDRSTGKSYTATTFTHPFTYTKGQKKMIWNAAKDGISFKSSDVVCTVTVTSGGGGSEGLYCVVDLSGGISAASYPVTYLTAVPSGGWSDEYKTTKLVLRRLDAGTFTMGSPSDELGRWDDETQHQVTLTKGFYIGVFEVTQRQWELVMGTRPSCFNNSAYYASRPVECVSYDMIRGSSSGSQWPASNAVDADSFLGKIRAKTGLIFDLPTEAQWEYACRAGTTTALNSGKNLTRTDQDAEMDKVGRYWYNGGSRCSQSCDPSAATAKVGSYAPNAWGLYDMHGNVLEWCLDWRQIDLGTSAVTDPVGPASGDGRDLRGGDWASYARYCRSALRIDFHPSNEGSNDGFRLACTAGSSK